jgi:Zn-dependent M16 (insulinase) family peptidase
MKTISGKVIERTWKRINETTEENAQQLMDEMAKHQPFIVAYLLAVEETMMSGNQRGQLMLIGLIVWKIFFTENARLRSVTKEQLEGAEEANIRFLEELEAGSEMDHMSALQNLMSTYNQIEVLNAVIEALMSGHEDEPELAGDHIGLALLHLKTVLDCLDQ